MNRPPQKALNKLRFTFRRVTRRLRAFLSLARSVPSRASGKLRALLLGLRRSVTFGHERSRKVHAGKICSGQIRFSEDGHAHVSPSKFRAIHIRESQIYVSQFRAMKNRVRKIAPKKFHSAGLRFRQIGARQNRFRHVRVSEIGSLKIRVGQIRARQLGFT